LIVLTAGHTQLFVPMHAIHGGFLKIITTEIYGRSGSRSRLAMPSAAKLVTWRSEGTGVQRTFVGNWGEGIFAQDRDYV
jgi:hypothetical protein